MKILSAMIVAVLILSGCMVRVPGVAIDIDPWGYYGDRSEGHHHHHDDDD